MQLFKKCLFLILISFCILIKTVTAQNITSNNNCKKFPSFISKLGYTLATSAFSTTEKNKVGIVLLELQRDKTTKKVNANVDRLKTYQDESWKKYGYLSSITFDNKGNIYVIPTPFISLLQNKPWQMNKILKVNSDNGKMNVWMSFTADSAQPINNPYGMLGLTYNCNDSSIWSSTVYGSSRHQEAGIIYHIDMQSKKIIDTLLNVDALALAINEDENQAQRLYYSSPRNGKILSYIVDKRGLIIRTSKRVEVSLENLGLRGDDKGRKIRFINNSMIITGKTFNYNLEATSDKIESTYTFQWGRATNRWILQSIE